jgi:hypothetical protein
MELLVTDLIRTGAGTVPARVDWGRWVADCLWCNGAALLTVGAPIFECPCGALWEVVWPAEDMVRGITRLLMMRPQENRWWAPGDTLTLLLVENVQHGILNDLPSGPLGPVFAVDDHRIVSDQLPALTSRASKAVTV